MLEQRWSIVGANAAIYCQILPFIAAKNMGEYFP
jgi:hypothetical protein